MVPQNKFRAFATGPNAIIQTQEDYEKSTALKEGFRKGLARSSEVNKALRQASSIAAATQSISTAPPAHGTRMKRRRRSSSRCRLRTQLYREKSSA